MDRKPAVQQLARMESLLSIAERLGYQIRNENQGGRGGGVFHFQNRKWLFIDLALSTADNLTRLEECLDPAEHRSN